MQRRRTRSLQRARLRERRLAREKRERMLTAMNADFERLRGNDAAWRAFRRESADWDTASFPPAEQMREWMLSWRRDGC